MKKLSIKEPCHENWNDFTPTQRGAFCGKCQINVIDFSNKSNAEIKSILAQNFGKKMCGRFSKTQLNDFNTEYYNWQNQSPQVFQSKFILALVLTFGLTLFSCQNQNQTLAMQQLNSFLTPTTHITSNYSETDSTKQTTQQNQVNDSIKTSCGTINTIDEDFEIMGEIEIPEEQMTKGKVKIESIDEEADTLMIPEIPEMPQVMMLGMIAYHEDIIETPVEIEDTVKNALENENTIITLTDKFEANLFPNPTKNNATLNINILAKENYSIAIYDLQGKLITSIFEGEITPQQKTFRINLDNQKNGIYFIKIVTQTQNESLKLIKTN